MSILILIAVISAITGAIMARSNQPLQAFVIGAIVGAVVVYGGRDELAGVSSFRQDMIAHIIIGAVVGLVVGYFAMLLLRGPQKTSANGNPE